MDNNKYNITKPNVKYPSGQTGPLPRGFDTMMLPDPTSGFVCGLVGMRGSGKTALLHNLLTKQYMNCFDFVYIFSPSAPSCDPTLSPDALQLPPECFFDHIDIDFINAIFAKQIKEKEDFDKELKKKNNPLNKSILKPKNLSRGLFVFDDCLTDIAMSKNMNSNNNIINKICFRGRHMRINCFICSQYYNALPLRARANIPNWFLFGTQNKRERENITKEQTGNVNEDVFNQMFDQATQEQYNFFFIYGTCPNPKYRYRRNIDNILEY